MPSLKLPLWRSAGEHAHPAEPTPEFAEKVQPITMDRRSFVQLLGAATAFAASAGCLKPPDDKILPYTRQPEEVVPGNPLHYASASTLGGHATGLLVTANEGRPTKVEGNPEHPSSMGASGLLEQGMLLQLYDPHRLAFVMYQRGARSWHDFLTTMAERARVLKEARGKGLRFLMEPSSSPLIAKLRERILELYPLAKFSTWSAVPLQQIHDGAQLALGAPYETRHDLSKASVIASIDDDFLSSLPGTLPRMRAFADRRGPGERQNRLYSIETSVSVTGMSADHRLRARPSQVLRIALALAAKLVPQLASAAPQDLAADQAKFVDALARDLRRAGTQSVVLAGARQPPLVHGLVHAINAALASAAVSYAKPVLHDLDAGPRALRTLTEEMRAGEVDTLVITAWNPAYGAPADLNFGKALSSVPTSVYRSLFNDETAERAGWVLPATHQLETWGDARGHDGTVTFQQPLIAPLFNGVTEVETLAAFLGEGDRSPYAHLRDLYQDRASDQLWEKWLSDGFIKDSATATEKVAVRFDAIAAAAAAAPAATPAPGFELNVIPDYKLWDGRFANNAWLLELPCPVTKLSWENAALLSPATARELGVAEGDLIDIGLHGPPAHAPVLILPGHADGAVSVAMGWGRKGQGEQLAENVGFDTATLRHSDAPWFASGATIAAVGRTHPLALTQHHNVMEGRSLAMVTTAEEFRKEPHFLEDHRGVPPHALEPHDYSHGYKWGMAIDLSRCTGCTACSIACQAENNIPVVGKDNVRKNREMHWLRIDRYFTGEDLENPGFITQPVACVHCEMAPCEYVCPVNATVHSDEGLNEMVYNRCVGTRYCSNNCPYKVRRFNFFAYNNEYSDTEKMVFNPDVTVRARGVMEKCSYCVQRIERVRIRSRVEERPMNPGELVTACQQACPTQAIVFGDLNDPKSQVSEWSADERRYDLLHELGTRPRTAYLARIRNPNPELA
jgi:Fe-S-cluster-containing dehydrogenase component/anaerobic selenocysteine-containing dehydrogenase